MKHLSCLFLFISVLSLNSYAQSSLTKQDIDKYLKAYEIFNFTEEERTFINTHSISADPQAPAYIKMNKMIVEAGFNDYADFKATTIRIIRAYRVSKTENKLNMPADALLITPYQAQIENTLLHTIP